MIPGLSAERGFTLLEVLVALAIFAVVAAAMGSAMQHMLGQTWQLEGRLLANWLADNHLARLRLQPTPGAGERQFEVDFAERRWVVEERRRVLPGEHLLQIELSVHQAGEQGSLHQVTGWLEVLRDAD